MKSSSSCRVIGSAVVLAGAYLLKDFYSQAGSEQLAWIIGPTALLTEIFSGLAFVHEPGFGWLDVQHHTVIAPVCAGVNFLIIAFCMSSFQILWKKDSPKEMIVGVIIASSASYLITLIANATRITLSVLLFSFDIYSAWVTPEMLHRVAGIVIYYLLLFSYSSAISHFFKNAAGAPPASNGPISRHIVLLAPLFWYLAFSIGVPVANNALHNNPEQFIAHSLTIGAVTAGLTVILFKLKRWKRLR
jgi:exosortase K